MDELLPPAFFDAFTVSIADVNFCFHRLFRKVEGDVLSEFAV